MALGLSLGRGLDLRRHPCAPTPPPGSPQGLPAELFVSSAAGPRIRVDRRIRRNLNRRRRNLDRGTRRNLNGGRFFLQIGNHFSFFGRRTTFFKKWELLGLKYIVFKEHYKTVVVFVITLKHCVFFVDILNTNQLESKNSTFIIFWLRRLPIWPGLSPCKILIFVCNKTGCFLKNFYRNCTIAF